MRAGTPKKLSPAKRMGGCLLLLVVILGSFAVGWVLVGRSAEPPQPPDIPGKPAMIGLMNVYVRQGFIKT